MLGFSFGKEVETNCVGGAFPNLLLHLFGDRMDLLAWRRKKAPGEKLARQSFFFDKLVDGQNTQQIKWQQKYHGPKVLGAGNLYMGLFIRGFVGKASKAIERATRTRTGREEEGKHTGTSCSLICSSKYRTKAVRLPWSRSGPLFYGIQKAFFSLFSHQLFSFHKNSLAFWSVSSPLLLRPNCEKEGVVTRSPNKTPFSKRWRSLLLRQSLGFHPRRSWKFTICFLWISAQDRFRYRKMASAGAICEPRSSPSK